MPNSEYWKQRFTQLEEARNKKANETFADIAVAYRKAEKQLEAEVDRWYRRFMNDNGIVDMADAKKLLTKGELQEFKWDVKEYLKYAQDNMISGQWEKQLENASARYHISRLEALRINSAAIIEELFSKEEQALKINLSDAYQDDYYKTIYEVQKGYDTYFNVAKLDPKEVEKIISKPWAPDGYNFSERIWQDKNKLINNVHKELMTCLLTGESPQKAIGRLQKAMGTARYNAKRLVLTETAAAASYATQDSYRDLDVEKYEIVATLDSRTSDVCQSMDGKVLEMKDYRVGLSAPPFHPNCRTTTVPAFDKKYNPSESRAARDEGGKTYYVDSDIKYPEWKAKYVDKTKPMPKSAENNAKTVDKSGKSGIIKEKSQTSIKEKRGQLDTGYKGKIPDEKLDEYNSKALEQIKKDTGYSDGDAEEFHKALQIYFGGDYEAVLSGNTGTAQTISKGIERMPVYDGKIYRGMTFSKYSDGNIEDFINLKPGDKIPEKGIITSWSSNKRVAESFGSLSTQSAESSSVILECENNNKGVGVQHISKFGAREAEVLSNAHYEVVDINVKSKYDYVSNRKDLLYFPEDLDDLENELKEQAVCIIKVKEV